MSGMSVWGDADDADIVAHARQNGLALMTQDLDFGDVRNYPPDDHAGIVVVDLPSRTHEDSVVRVVRSFVSDPRISGCLSGRPAIVEAGRFRLR